MILHSKILGNIDKPPLLILHGFLGLSDNWKTMGSKLQDLGYQVHLIDQRNHGSSFHSDEFSYQLLAQDLHYYINHHNLSEVSIVGHSMGGKTGMCYAVNYPETVSRLVVVDIAPKRYNPSHEFILRGAEALEELEITSRDQAVEVLGQYVADRSVQLFVLKNLYWEGDLLKLRFNTKGLVKNYDQVLASPLSEGEQYLGQNVLFVQGTKSNYITPSEIPLLQKHVPNYQLDQIDAGHWVHAEAPEPFFKVLEKFLTS